ncbi:hypothetical protein FBEOM_4995 [Fusarium beomiforme]|uniref:Uncharacterized protein n=1 Tax=Fusarium beomiforme TaxID=44412 RepID=A0A9P5DZG1_9HYPO|nr:hypothetical protein FBEOM_4995 [Fusarium beomiforme]
MAGNRRRDINGLAEVVFDGSPEDFDEPDDVAPGRRRPFSPVPYRGLGGRLNNIIIHSRVGQSRATYIVNREVLRSHLPRARETPRRGILMLSTYFPEPPLPRDEEGFINWALDFLFQYLTSETTNLSGAAMQDIEYSLNRIDAINDWAARMNALCIVLNYDGGLGCAEALLDKILDFAEYLIHEVHDHLGWNETAHLFEALAGIVWTLERDQEHKIRRIWNYLDPLVQRQVLGDIRSALPIEDANGKSHRMYRILGY